MTRRFERLARLLGEPAIDRLGASHVLVVGVGGVGSHAAEALARSAVGRLTLVDFDSICPTNTNRQLQALSSTEGQPKAPVLARRLRDIHPGAEITALSLRFDESTSDRVLAPGYDYVVDCIDTITAKCHLLAECRRRGLRAICSTGAGGRLDPTCVEVADLAHTRIDRLAFWIRKFLRQHHGFPRKGAFDLPAVYSTEPPREPLLRSAEDDDRHTALGTAGFLTATFGHTAASVVVRDLAGTPTG